MAIAVQRPAGAGHLLAVGQHAVGRVVAVERRIGARRAAFDHQRCAADDRRAGPLGQRRGGGRMVAVGVGAHDRHDLRAADRALERGEVVGLGRARVDHRQPLRVADEVGLRAGIGEGRGVGRQHAAHQRLELFDLAGRPGLRGHRHGTPLPFVSREVETC